MRRFPVWLVLLMGCGDDGGASAPADDLPLLSMYPLGIEDPSGIDVRDGRLYIVGDRGTEVHVWTASGVPIDVVDTGIESEAPDIEGVVATDDGFLLAHEADGVLLGSLPGAARFPVPDARDGNNGLEGLTVRPGDGHIFAVKEKKPTVLFELDRDGTELDRHTLDVAPDIAGLAQLGDPSCPDQLLAVSQESREVLQLTTAGEVLGRWAVSAKRPEGVAYDGKARLYVVDESKSRLLVYTFPGGCL